MTCLKQTALLSYLDAPGNFERFYAALMSDITDPNAEPYTFFFVFSNLSGVICAVLGLRKVQVRVCVCVLRAHYPVFIANDGSHPCTLPT